MMADGADIAPGTDIATGDEDPAKAARLAKRKKWLIRLALLVAAVAISWLVWYLVVGRNRVTTDNAYVNAEMAQITPLISGTVTAVKVKDTDFVHKGDILVELDRSDSRIAVAEAEAALATARREFQQAQAMNGALSARVGARSADIAMTQAQLSAAEGDMEKAATDLRRREALASSGAVSGEELTDARKSYSSARAALATARAAIVESQSARAAAQGDLAANQALVSDSNVDTAPAVLAAKARLESARNDLDDTIIKAPIDGVVVKRHVQLGQRVEQGAQIMAIIPIGQVYIDANFKERQLTRVKVGMAATVTADIYGGDIVYHGKVAGIAGGTGAAMSLIPAQNATGNWIKVVQRLPVRIELDPKELAKNPLRVGLSTEVKIDLAGE